MEGYNTIVPFIKKVNFPVRGKMAILLEDGREIICPLSQFPSIKKLSSEQRKQIQIIDRVGFSFLDCPEVFHIEQVLGDYDSYRYRRAS